MSSSPPPAAGSSTPPAGVYYSLEHWRGLAALSVVFFHAAGTGPTSHPFVAALQVPARFGWLGVHLFFVISGYCIGANIESLRRRGVGAGAFLRDRFCRIVPTYWAAFGASLALALLAGRISHVPLGDQIPITGRAWLANLLLLQPFLETGFYVIVYWTLPVELGFYLLVGLLFAGSRRLGAWAAGLAVALALGTLWLPEKDALYTLTCWPEFVCGLLVFHALRADAHQDKSRRNRCLGLLVLLGVTGAVATGHVVPRVHTDQQAPFAALFALGLYALYPLDASLRRAPVLRWLEWGGVFSFSLYLMHYPVLVRTLNIERRFVREDGPWQALAVVGSCVVSVLASYGFYLLTERRFERWRRRFKGRTV